MNAGQGLTSKVTMHWRDLEPDQKMLSALDHAGQRPLDGNQNEKRHWSERLANACAVAIADELRDSALSNKKILPGSLAGGTEPLTPLGAGTSKRIDVTVADAVLGLELGFSLKGLNFRDSGAGNFDKNLTGRLYELGDEVRMVHEHLPHAFMAGVFFLPLDSTIDKTDRAQSSFAHTVIKLRERTGRLDAALAAHAPRCDSSWVGLYTVGDEAQGFPRGIVRFFNVGNAPPRRGRPRVETTLSLTEMVQAVVGAATFTSNVEYAEPEPD